MTRILVVFTAALLVTLGAVADTHVKMETHTDSFYRGGTVTPAEDSAQEMWIGEKTFAFINEGTRIVIDLEKKHFLYIKTNDNIYFQGELPCELAKMLSPEEAAMIAIYPRTGEIKKTDKKKKIGERECQVYEINNWVDYEGSKYSENDIVAWVTTDVPIDLKSLKEMFVELLGLQNMTAEYRDKVASIAGFQIASETTRYAEGMSIKSSEQVTEITEAEPPEGIYTAPKDFAKQEKLTLEQLRD